MRTYAQLEDYVRAFAGGHINLLILIGPPGLAKSRTVRSILRESAYWIEGNATAFGMYLELFRNRDRMIVIDDVDSLYADRNAIRLLKCLCQTEATKTVAWHSATNSLDRAQVPREFLTTSRVIIICNDWQTLNRNVAALQDRGHMLAFQPTAAEVHFKASEWVGDLEVLSWFESNLYQISEPSLRLYVRAAELHRAGMDWQDTLPLATKNKRLRLVAELKADTSHATEESRVRSFRSKGGGCRSTYFNYVRLVKSARH